ncbi:MAG: hypothetical protein M1832_006134 [Thelocarpon impressellum]|nr:MAG: hypothetical protein M1832_006134 [Thelocarpon impressellum]
MVKAYCPPLDPALFFAISSDYDRHDAEAVRQMRLILDPLKQSALDAESAPMDADHGSDSWLGVGDSTSERADSSHERSSYSSDLLSPSQSSWHGHEGTLLDDADPDENPSEDAKRYAISLEDLGTDGKVSLLEEMFPRLKAFNVVYALKKCEHNFSRTVEELLNQVFFEEEEELGQERLQAKGVDGFAEELVTNTKKSKGKKKRQQRNNSRSSPLPTTAADESKEVNASKWDSMRQDVDFVTSRTKLPMQNVSSLYHKSGAGLSATVRSMLDAEKQVEWDPAELGLAAEVNAIDLGRAFPSVATVHIFTLIRLTHPSAAAAHDLARVLTQKPPKPQGHAGIQIITRLPPIDLGLPDKTVRPHAAADRPASLSQATALSKSHGLARQAAFSQASAAYRKSKSDHLMGAVAGYYSSVGREHDAQAKTYGSAAADALVDAQSGRNELDLHGVSVRDAVRIARERVTTWWASPGASRVGGREGVGGAYRIVTGKGLHSEGGKGRIGPAVGRMLVREGWKVEVGSGSLTVTGVAKPR